MNCYTELIEKRNKIAEELRNLDQEIKKQEKIKAQSTIVDIIEKIQELKKYDPFAIFSIEVFCEGCEIDIDTNVDFDDLIQLFEEYGQKI